MKISVYLFLAALIAVMICHGSSFAHGKETHSDKKVETKEDGDHMEAMDAVRASIPDDLRGLDLPVWATDESKAARGAALYRRNCANCHGKEGRGDGHMVSSIKFKPSDLTDREHSSFFSVGEKFWIVTNGMPGMGMPPFGKRLSEEERWLVVAHILEFAGAD